MAGKAKPADVEEEDDKPEGEQSTATSKFKFKLKLPPLKWMIIGAAGFLVLAGGGGGAYFFLKGSDRAKEPQAAVKPATCRSAGRPSEPVQYRHRPDPVSQGQDRARTAGPDPGAADTAADAKVMDAFQTYLRELRPTDLDGSAGLYRLKEELTRRVNAAVAPNRVTAVLFKEIVVQ